MLEDCAALSASSSHTLHHAEWKCLEQSFINIPQLLLRLSGLLKKSLWHITVHICLICLRNNSYFYGALFKAFSRLVYNVKDLQDTLSDLKKLNSALYLQVWWFYSLWTFLVQHVGKNAHNWCLCLSINVDFHNKIWLKITRTQNQIFFCYCFCEFFCFF